MVGESIGFRERIFGVPTVFLSVSIRRKRASCAPAYIAAVLLAAGLAVPAVAEAAQPLANVQQPVVEEAAQLKRQQRSAGGDDGAPAPASRAPPRGRRRARRRPADRPASFQRPRRPGSPPFGLVQFDAELVADSPRPGPGRSTASRFRRAGSGAGRNRGGGGRAGQYQPPQGAPAPPRASRRRPGAAPRRAGRGQAGKADGGEGAGAAPTSPARTRLPLRSSGQAEKAAGETPPEPQEAGKSRRQGLKQGSRPSLTLRKPMWSASSARPSRQVAHSKWRRSATSTTRLAGSHLRASQIRRALFAIASPPAARAAARRRGNLGRPADPATQSDCRAPFDEMARTLAKRFGEARIEPANVELIHVTLPPAAKQAAAAGTPSSHISLLPVIPDGNTPTQ